MNDFSVEFLQDEMRWLQTTGNSTNDDSEPDDSTALISSTDSDILRDTLRVYGSIYAACILLYTLLRLRRPKLFNVRSWARSNPSELACVLQYSWCNWLWKVFDVSDRELLDECGLDAVCFLRALQFGRQLCTMGILNAIWLIPLYRTAPESPETDYLDDRLVKISIANLPSSSMRFLGTVVSAYIMFGYAMYLIFHQARWFTRMRHLFLRRTEPRNYAVYVSGIPEAYQSSYKLESYFRQSGASERSVLEAHICHDTPKLDALVQKRANLIAQLEHAVALERRTGQTVRHTKIHWRRTSSLCCYACTSTLTSCRTSSNSLAAEDSSGPDEINIMERVNSVHTLDNQLRSLNRSIQRRIGEILALSSRRAGLSRSSGARLDLLKAIQEDAAADLSRSSSSDVDDDDNEACANPAASASSSVMTAKRENNCVVEHRKESDGDSDDDDEISIMSEKKESGMRRRLRTFSETLGAAVMPLSAKPASLHLHTRSATLNGGGDVGTTSAISPDTTATAVAVASTPSISRPNSIRQRFTTIATASGGSGGDTETTTAALKPSSIRHRSTTFAAAALPSRKSSRSATPIAKPRFGRGISASLKFSASEEPDDDDSRDALLARALESGVNLYSRNNSTEKEEEEKTIHHHQQQSCSSEEEKTWTEEADSPSPATAVMREEAVASDFVAVENVEPMKCLDATLDLSDAVTDPSSFSNGNRLEREPPDNYLQEWLQQEMPTTPNTQRPQDFHQQWLRQSPKTPSLGQEPPLQQHRFPSPTDDYDECSFVDNWLAAQRHDENGTHDVVISAEEALTESHVDDDDQEIDGDWQPEEIMAMMDGDVEIGVGVGMYRCPARAFSEQNICPARALTEQSSSNSIVSAPNGSDECNNNRRMYRSEGAITESTRSGWSTPSSSKHSHGSRASSRSVVTDSIRRGTRVVGMAGSTFAQGSRVAGSTLAKGSQVVGSSIAKGSQVATLAVGTSAEWLVQSVGETGGEALKKANKVGSHIVSSAGAVVPSLLLNKEEGKARNAGFVVFNNLYACQTALQMIHHPKPYVMDVIPAPDPKQIFWRNVGLPSHSKRMGTLTALVSTAGLCCFWSIPMAFVSSMTEVNSLKESLPWLGKAVDKNPWLENFLAQLAPLTLLAINEGILPVILKYFGTWEGHISSAMLEASLFTKMGCFMIIQTFFVAAISGGITSEITNILANPESVIDFLANSLPSQSNFFIQITLAQTFILQAIETLRIYPLGVAWLRRCIGPRLTAKERRKAFGWLCSLEEPPDFWHAETFAQMILFFVVYFVYCSIAPVTSIFLFFCFILCESGYRYQFIHNYPRAFETGGALWRGFIHFVLASMVIAELTLIGLLALKKSKFAPALIPLIIITVLFIMFINAKHSLVSRFLPTRECILLDSENRTEGEMNMDFVKGAYLQPSLQHPFVEPDYDEGTEEYAAS